MQHNQHNIVAGDGLYDFRPEKFDKVLIIINYFALQQAVALWQFVTRDEALAHETSGVEIDRCTYPTQRCTRPIAAADAKESSISGAA